MRRKLGLSVLVLLLIASCTVTRSLNGDWHYEIDKHRLLCLIIGGSANAAYCEASATDEPPTPPTDEG